MEKKSRRRLLELLSVSGAGVLAGCDTFGQSADTTTTGRPTDTTTTGRPTDTTTTGRPTDTTTTGRPTDTRTTSSTPTETRRSPTSTPTDSPAPTQTDSPALTDTPTPAGTPTPRACAGINLTEEGGLWIRIAFDRGVTLSDGREVSIRIDSITIRGGTGHRGRQFNVGAGIEAVDFVEGAYEPSRSGGRTYRWFEPTFTLQFLGYNEWDFNAGITVVADTSAYDDDVLLTRCSEEFDRQRLSPASWHEVYFGFRRYGPPVPGTPT